MRIACTGFVAAQAGSVAAANALLLVALLEAGCEVDFFSKPSFVDPRPAVGNRERFRFVPVVNGPSDSLRRRTARLPGVKLLTSRLDAHRYNRLLGRRIAQEHRHRAYDLVLWLGDYARHPVPGVKTVSFVQGPPGTDARSILHHRDAVRQLAGRAVAWRWALLARLRLSRWGLPPFAHTDHFIVGSSQSRQTLSTRYGIPPERVSALPYPIDLRQFRPATDRADRAPGDPFRALWLGRIVPRKRLDLFLDGASEAIRRGCNIELTIAGGIGFVPGYEKTIAAFPHPNRLQWIKSVPREEVPALLNRHDVLVQPSEEEDFGSSVAEAQACGLPVIVGRTNGNRDYLSSRDTCLAADTPAALADALCALAQAPAAGSAGPLVSRQHAEHCFAVEQVAAQLLQILATVRAAVPSGDQP